MIKKLMESVFGTRHEREVKRMQPLLDAIHGEEAKLRRRCAGRPRSSAGSSPSAPAR
jgi:hypothetical protein